MGRKKKGPSLKEWLSQRLLELVDMPDPDFHIATHILSLQDGAMREYGKSFFGDTDLTSLLIEETIYKRKFGVRAVYKSPKTQRVPNTNILKKPTPGGLSSSSSSKASSDEKDINAKFDYKDKAGTQVVEIDRYGP